MPNAFCGDGAFAVLLCCSIPFCAARFHSVCRVNSAMESLLCALLALFAGLSFFTVGCGVNSTIFFQGNAVSNQNSGIQKSVHSVCCTCYTSFTVGVGLSNYVVCKAFFLKKNKQVWGSRITLWAMPSQISGIKKQERAAGNQSWSTPLRLSCWSVESVSCTSLGSALSHSLCLYIYTYRYNAIYVLIPINLHIRTPSCLSYWSGEPVFCVDVPSLSLFCVYVFVCVSLSPISIRFSCVCILCDVCVSCVCVTCMCRVSVCLSACIFFPPKSYTVNQSHALQECLVNCNKKKRRAGRWKNCQWLC